MTQNLKLVVALAIGIALAGITTYGAGFAAALPIPLPTRYVLAMAITIGIVASFVPAFLVGRLTYRFLNSSVPLVILACALPWLVECGYELYASVSGLQSYPEMLDRWIHSWGFMVGVPARVLPVPLGLWLASKKAQQDGADEVSYSHS